MKAVKNALMLFGLLSLLALAYLGAQALRLYQQTRGYDPQAWSVYREVLDKLLATGSLAEATVWKAEVRPGLSPQDVELAMKSAAIEHNIRDVGELPLSRQVEAATGKPYRLVKIYMFCSPLTAARMLDYHDAFSAYLPCRVTLVQDPQGRLALYTLNLDLLVYGGKELPPALKDEAVRVRDTIQDILRRGATGSF